MDSDDTSAFSEFGGHHGPHPKSWEAIPTGAAIAMTHTDYSRHKVCRDKLALQCSDCLVASNYRSRHPVSSTSIYF